MTKSNRLDFTVSKEIIRVSGIINIVEPDKISSMIFWGIDRPFECSKLTFRIILVEEKYRFDKKYC